MCGRYDLTELPIEQFEQLLGRAIGNKLGDVEPRYNIAPTQNVPIIRRAVDGKLEAVSTRWGLLPFWAKEPKLKYSTINARAETVDRAPAFREAFEHRRCLVPATGWYEWQTLPGAKNKQPWRIHLRDNRPVAFAGLWERWKGDGQIIESNTIIVTDAVQMLSETHDRMPVILNPEAARQWMSIDEPSPAGLKALLRPYLPPDLEWYKVSTRVNNARTEAPDLIAAME
jgi:putative SOS response-associated peptidase YedK